MLALNLYSRNLGRFAELQRAQSRAVSVEQLLFLTRRLHTDEHAKHGTNQHNYKPYPVGEIQDAKAGPNRRDYKSFYRAYLVGKIQNAKGAANRHDYKAYPAGEIQDAKGAANQHHYKAYPVGEIQQKKEELYDIISRSEKEFMSIRQNRLLLQYLSVQIKPRPNDPEWRRLWATKRAAYWIGLTGFMSFIVVTCLFGLGN